MLVFYTFASELIKHKNVLNYALFSSFTAIADKESAHRDDVRQPIEHLG